MRASWLALLGWLLASAPVAAQTCFGNSGSAIEDWTQYKARFLAADGRIIDTGNQNISHSEGQGFGMRLAVFFQDRQTFEQIWRWTREHLYVRGDRLAAWRWQPEAAEPIQDRNNASDGDLLLAWALALAGRYWSESTYTDAARAIAADIRQTLLRPTRQGLLLLPGATGFEREDGLILNPSYWVFPALRDLAVLEPDAREWPDLLTAGLNLLENARFSRWRLPPDWVRWKEQFDLPGDFKPRFGYDAIRIPLYLIWGGFGEPNRLRNFTEFWDQFAATTPLPDWADLSNDTVSQQDAPAGIKAVVALTRFVARSQRDAAFLSLPSITTDTDYYSASLLLLVRIAAAEWCQASDSRPAATLAAPPTPHFSS
jgi:endoglucanase